MAVPDYADAASWRIQEAATTIGVNANSRVHEPATATETLGGSSLIFPMLGLPVLLSILYYRLTHETTTV